MRFLHTVKHFWIVSYRIVSYRDILCDIVSYRVPYSCIVPSLIHMVVIIGIWHYDVLCKLHYVNGILHQAVQIFADPKTSPLVCFRVKSDAKHVTESSHCDICSKLLLLLGL